MTTGCTALHYAAANGYINVAKYLVESAGANIKHKSNKGYEPQHMARRRGQVKMVSFLTDFGQHCSDYIVYIWTLFSV